MKKKYDDDSDKHHSLSSMFATACGHMLHSLSDKDFREDINKKVGDDLVEDLFSVIKEMEQKAANE